MPKGTSGHHPVYPGDPVSSKNPCILSYPWILRTRRRMTEKGLYVRDKLRVIARSASDAAIS
jgi:hypothetical protein